jgi:hypothetical protein
VLCHAKPDTTAIYTHGKYILGVRDGILIAEQNRAMIDATKAGTDPIQAGQTFRGDSFCLTEDVSIEQTADVVVKYIRDNPKLRNLRTGYLIHMALHDAFPCKPGAK